MVKAIRFFSTKIEIPLNSHVQVRIKNDFPFDNQDLNKLNKAYNTAVQYVKAALDEIRYFKATLHELSLLNQSTQGETLRQSTQQSFSILTRMLKQHFNITFENNLPIHQEINDLKSVLSRMYEGLKAEKNVLYISNGSKKQKYKALGYVNSSVDETIYLNLPYLLPESEILIRTIIHEASHLFSKTDDYACYYLERSDDNFMSKKFNQLMDGFFSSPKEKLSTSNRIHHASSIENFIFELMTTNNVLKRSTKSNEEIPGGKLILSERPNKTFFQKIVAYNCVTTFLADTPRLIREEAKYLSETLKEKIGYTCK